jgi:hypothetical protein
MSTSRKLLVFGLLGLGAAIITAAAVAATFTGPSSSQSP